MVVLFSDDDDDDDGDDDDDDDVCFCNKWRDKIAAALTIVTHVFFKSQVR